MNDRGLIRVVFMGTGEIGVPSLRLLATDPRAHLAGVVTQPDQPAGRHLKMRAPEPKRIAMELGVPVIQPARLRSVSARETLVEWAPDLIVVMAYGQILRKAVLDLPPLGCLNLHASLLPRHRGASPVHAAVLANDPESGVTAMWMDEGLDTGDILLAKSIPLAPDETAGSLHDRLADLAAAVLTDALAAIVAGSRARQPQDPGRATHAPKLTRDSGRMDWSHSASDLARQVRGMHPWPGAYTFIERPSDASPQRLKILSAAVVTGAHGDAASSQVPGAVASMQDGELAIACGQGAAERLVLLQVQLEGKRAMSSAELLRGFPLPPGTRLGSF